MYLVLLVQVNNTFFLSISRNVNLLLWDKTPNVRKTGSA